MNKYYSGIPLYICELPPKGSLDLTNNNYYEGATFPAHYEDPAEDNRNKYWGSTTKTEPVFTADNFVLEEDVTKQFVINEKLKL